MPAYYLRIEEKHRDSFGRLASLADFSVSEDGEAVAAKIVLSSPNISLYCLDDATQRAIFVELPPDIDLSLAPFVYQVQFEHSLRLIAMSYDDFRAVAHPLPAVQNLILVFSAARSGSTLLSHVFNAQTEVLSLSEPDVVTQFVHMRLQDGSRDAELSELLDCTVRILCKPNPFKTPTTYAIKFRSEAIQTMDLFHATFPQAKILYLYRDAVGYIASFYRLFKGADMPETQPLDDYIASFKQMNRYDFTQFLSYLAPNATQISIPEQIAFMWLINLEWYQAQVARGIPVLAVRYSDLNTQREATLTAIFAYCGLPVDQVTQSLVAFEKDSQAGTMLAREKSTEGNAIQLSEAQIAEIQAILFRHPVINTSDFVLPGTLKV